MGNNGLPVGLGVVLAGAILGALIVGGLVVGMVVGAAVQQPSQPLVADFSTVGAGGNNVAFSADRTAGGHTPYKTYEWDFNNDGVVDKQGDGTDYRDVIYEYSGPGTYVAKLTVTDGADDTDTTYQSVAVA
jgi:PKD repeat protein